MNNIMRPVQKVGIEVRDFSLDQAMPQLAAAIEEQIDCDEASDDLIKEKLHSDIRASSADSMTKLYGGTCGVSVPVMNHKAPREYSR